MEAHLPAFKEKNPHLEVVTELVRGQHPNLKGIYSKIFFFSLSILHCNIVCEFCGTEFLLGITHLIVALDIWIGIEETLAVG